jgi:HD-GYP domain-containing protein (c-di-GMP phosphodiesterase class II)
MTTDRPYRRALSREAALAELVDNAGTQFDPKIVGVLLDVLGRHAPVGDESALPACPRCG